MESPLMLCCLKFGSPFFSLSKRKRQHNNELQMYPTLKSLICVFIRRFLASQQCESSHYDKFPDIENLFAGMTKINRDSTAWTSSLSGMYACHRSYHIKEWFVLPVCRHASFAYLLRLVFKAVFNLSFIDLRLEHFFVLGFFLRPFSSLLLW